MDGIGTRRDLLPLSSKVLFLQFRERERGDEVRDAYFMSQVGYIMLALVWVLSGCLISFVYSSYLKPLLYLGSGSIIYSMEANLYATKFNQVFSPAGLLRVVGWEGDSCLFNKSNYQYLLYQ